MVYVTRKAHFSASHRLFNPNFSDQENESIFDKCNNFHGHGHNYELEVTVKGIPDPETGYVIDLKKLARLIDDEILARPGDARAKLEAAVRVSFDAIDQHHSEVAIFQNDSAYLSGRQVAETNAHA